MASCDRAFPRTAADDLLQAVGHSVIAVDNDGRITFWNRAAEQMYGYAAAETVGQPMRGLLTIDDDAARGEKIVAAVRSGESWSGRFTVRRRDGSTFPALVTTAPVVDTDGAVVGMIGVSLDLTEQVAAEERLRVSEERFRRRFSDAPIPQAILTVDGTIEEVNPAIAERAGLPAEQMVGRCFTDFVDRAEHDQMRVDLDAVVGGATTCITSTHRYVGANGSTTWGLTSMVLLRAADGAPEHVALFLQDVSAEREALADAAVAHADLAASERRFRALVNRSADVAMILDAAGTITYTSPALQAVFGYDATDMIGRSGFDYIHPDDRPRCREVLAEVVAQPGTHDPFELRVRAADGRYVWTEEVLTNSLDEPGIGGIVVNLRDISARKAAEDERSDTERRYRDIVEQAEEGIWATDADGLTNFVNPRLCEMLGRPAGELVGRPVADFVPAEERAALAARMADRATGTRSRHECRLVHSDGHALWVWVSSHPRVDATGSFIGVHAMITDISDLKEVERQLRHNALHDELTGLANRSLLVDRVDGMLTRRGRHDDLSAVLFVDLDHFKLVNDALGHGAGDLVLVEVAARLAEAVRTVDTVARFGGDEFVVVCEDLHDRKEALDIGRRILAAVAEPIDVQGHQLVVTASVGVAYTPADDADALLRNADSAMYQAKSRGRGRVETHDAKALATVRDELVLSADLRRALDPGSDEIVVYYQPIVRVADQRVAGVEALVRWQHPTRGLLMPNDFVPLAERLGLIERLDRLVLRQACRQTGEWLRTGAVPQELTVAVNVSACHLADPKIAGDVRRTLTATGLDPRRLVIEVTETAVMDDAAGVNETLQALRDTGVGVALDDFGTGYSSLTYLKRIPADRLKIDRSFVGGLGGGDDDDAIVASIVSLAESINMGCIAEGVETTAQLSSLHQLGCRLAQGFLWSPAVPAARLPDVVEQMTPRTVRSPETRRYAQWAAEVDPPTRVRIMTMHRAGASLQTIAAALNHAGVRTPRGTRWHSATVARVVAEIVKAPGPPPLVLSS